MRPTAAKSSDVRTWTDRRDGRVWLIEAVAATSTMRDGILYPHPPRRGITFTTRPEDTGCGKTHWAPNPLGRPVHEFDEGQLMALLDRARESDPETGSRYL